MQQKSKHWMASEIGGIVVGLTKVIWSIIIALLVGTSTTGLYQLMLSFSFLLLPLGLYLAVTNMVDVLEVIIHRRH